MHCMVYRASVVALVALIGCGGAVPAPEPALAAVLESSLSATTAELLRGLDVDVEIVAVVTSDLPWPQDGIDEVVQPQLADYAAMGSRVRASLLTGAPDAIVDEAADLGVPRRSFEEVPDEGDEEAEIEPREVRGYAGAAVRVGGVSETVALTNEARTNEARLTMAVRRLTRPPVRVGVVRVPEAAELPAGEGMERLAEALPRHELVDVSLDAPLPESLDALILVAPTRGLDEAALRTLDAYVAEGGRLGVFGGAAEVTFDGATATGRTIAPPLAPLFESWGVGLRPSLVCSLAAERLRLPGELPLPVPYPPAPMVRTEALTGLARPSHTVGLFFTSPAVVDGARVDARPLIEVDRAWEIRGEEIDLRVRQPGEWRVEGADRVTVALGHDGPLPRAFGDGVGDSSRLLLVGTATPLLDRYRPPGAGPEPRLAELLLEWLLRDARFDELVAP
jgi:hypothetical protein